MKLKPCPFCGGEAKLKKGFPSRQIAHCRQAVVQCKECGCRTITFKQMPMERWQDVDKEAIETWNNRIDYLDREPTIDAVSVVRCKDCERRYEENGEYFCSHTDTSCGDDDFCSHGERKGE